MTGKIRSNTILTPRPISKENLILIRKSLIKPSRLRKPSTILLLRFTKTLRSNPELDRQSMIILLAFLLRIKIGLLDTSRLSTS
jgi:hypothetical protein